MGTWVHLPIVALLVFQTDRIVSIDINILHTNDVHAQIEQFKGNLAECTEADVTARQCFGGVARLRTKVEELRLEKRNLLFLDAGGQFQGTLWFYSFGGALIARVMNILGYNAMSPGNHEFDDGVSGLANFIRSVRFPLVSCNMDTSDEPTLSAIGNYTIFRLGTENVAVIGHTTPETVDLSRPGNVTFESEIEALRYNVEQLESAGINKIIALGNSGFEMDKRIAESVPGIDVIVGGKSNTFLYSGDPPSTEVPEGLYPTMVRSPRDEPVLIVHDYAYGKYLGLLEVTLNDTTGIVTNWSGNPILLDVTVQEDPYMLQQLSGYKRQLESLEQQIVAPTFVFLEGSPEKCRVEECNLGNLIADAMVRQNLQNLPDSWTDVAIAILNGGGIRDSIDAGAISVGKVLRVLPFRHTIDTVELTGQTIWDTLEYCASKWVDTGSLFGGFLQVSGLRIAYDMHKPINQRVADVQVLCTECEVPEYGPINTTQVYKVLMPNFLANGGDGYDVIKENQVFRYPNGPFDFDILLADIRLYSPIVKGLDGRIRFLDTTNTTNSTYTPGSTYCPDAASTLTWSISLFCALLAAVVSPTIISTL